MPRNRTEVEDGAATGGLHARHDGARHHGHVLEVDGDILVEELRGHFFQRVAVITRGIVDKDMDGAVGQDGGGRLVQRRHIGQVAFEEDRRRAQHAGVDRRRNIIDQVDEIHLGALLNEGGNEARADAGTAAGDQHLAVLQARIDGSGHRLLTLPKNYDASAWTLAALAFSSPRSARFCIRSAIPNVHSRASLE